jgi:hypothetical protein
MALTAIRYGAQNSVAIGGNADITGLAAAGSSIENDPFLPLETQEILQCNMTIGPHFAGRYFLF